MIKENLIWIGLTFGCALGLGSAITFRKIQESYFNQINGEMFSFQKKVQDLKKVRDFVSAHQKEIDYVTEKSWISPINRLIAREFLETLSPLLKKLSYRFDPETIKNFRDDRDFRVTQISFETEADTDVDLYMFLDELMKDFPGILIPRDLTFTRHKDKPGVGGKFVVDWVVMKEELNEE
jgi:hypothetical protein